MPSLANLSLDIAESVTRLANEFRNQAAKCARLKRKYEHAASHPWETVEHE